MSVPLGASWIPASPGVWDRAVDGDTWTLSVTLRGSVGHCTLTGPHPAPTWSTGVRSDEGVSHIMSLADDRIRRHYAVH